MRVFNEQDELLQREEIDLEKGYLKPDTKFVKHHEAIEAQAEVSHYKVKTMYFEDGSILKCEGDNEDPHIIIENASIGKFSYKNLEEENRVLKGIDVEKIIDQEAINAQDAYDEYEEIERYVLYTEEELTQQQEQKKNWEKQQRFISTGPERLSTVETTTEDLTIAIADYIFSTMSI